MLSCYTVEQNRETEPWLVALVLIHENTLCLHQIDALYPALTVLENNVSRLSSDTKNIVCEASKAASRGAEETKNMKAKAGRASYVASEKVSPLK